MPHDPILAILPESKAVYTLDKNLRPVVAELPTAGDAVTTKLGYVVIDELVSAGVTATATTLYKHGLTTGDEVIIDGASETEYNGTYTVTVISSRAFTYTFAGSGTTPATGSITAQFPAVSDDELTVTVCPAKDGGVWKLYDALAPRGFDASEACILRKFDPATGELLADVVRPNYGEIGAGILRIGEHGGYKCLMDVGCGRLLTNDRTTHDVIEIKVEHVNDGLLPVDPDTEDDDDNEIGRLVKTYSLVLDPFDAVVNAAATRLLYLDNGAAKVWDLEEDAAIRTVVASIPAAA